MIVVRQSNIIFVGLFFDPFKRVTLFNGKLKPL